MSGARQSKENGFFLGALCPALGTCGKVEAWRAAARSGHRRVPASTAELTLIKSNAAWKKELGVEVGYRMACRCSSTLGKLNCAL